MASAHTGRSTPVRRRTCKTGSLILDMDGQTVSTNCTHTFKTPRNSPTPYAGPKHLGSSGKTYPTSSPNLKSTAAEHNPPLPAPPLSPLPQHTHTHTTVLTHTHRTFQPADVSPPPLKSLSENPGGAQSRRRTRQAARATRPRAQGSSSLSAG